MKKSKARLDTKMTYCRSTSLPAVIKSSSDLEWVDLDVGVPLDLKYKWFIDLDLVAFLFFSSLKSKQLLLTLDLDLELESRSRFRRRIIRILRIRLFIWDLDLIVRNLSFLYHYNRQTTQKSSFLVSSFMLITWKMSKQCWQKSSLINGSQRPSQKLL